MGCANSKDVPDLDRTTTKEGHVEAFLAQYNCYERVSKTN